MKKVIFDREIKTYYRVDFQGEEEEEALALAWGSPAAAAVTRQRTCGYRVEYSPAIL